MSEYPENYMTEESGAYMITSEMDDLKEFYEFVSAIEDKRELPVNLSDILDKPEFEYGKYFSAGSGRSVLEDINPNLIEAVITEKTNLQKEVDNQISFEVERRANRVQIRKAVENIFNVRVAKVRTMQMKGKLKQRGRILGRQKDWKKAIVKLMPGERIDFFEGA